MIRHMPHVVSRLGLWLHVLRVREAIARRHLRGHGIEIGALSHPLRMPRGATVSYVDKWSVEDLRSQYPDLAGERIVSPDIVDDATTLATVSDNSQDFVVANHFLEHTEDPVAVLKRFSRNEARRDRLSGCSRQAEDVRFPPPGHIGCARATGS